MHSMQAGYMEKAQKYTDKACVYIEKLKSKSQQLPKLEHWLSEMFRKHLHACFLRSIDSFGPNMPI